MLVNEFLGCTSTWDSEYVYKTVPERQWVVVSARLAFPHQITALLTQREQRFSFWAGQCTMVPSETHRWATIRVLQHQCFSSRYQYLSSVTILNTSENGERLHTIHIQYYTALHLKRKSNIAFFTKSANKVKC